MKFNSKIFKTLFALVLIVPFFSSGQVVHANDNPAITACVSDAIRQGVIDSAARKVADRLLAETGGTYGAASTATGATETAVSVPVADAANHIVLGTISGINEAHSSFQDTTKMDLDAYAYSVAQCILTQLTDNTVNWIKGGFNGRPSFSVDLRGLVEDLAKGVAEDFATKIKNLQACDFTPNFIDDLSNSLTISPKKHLLPPKIKCPFPAQNITASQFYKDFSVAGWAGMEAALSDNGNRFAVRAATSEDLARRQEAAKAKNDQKLSWSNGFADLIDTENCNYPSDEVRAQANDPSFSPALREMYQKEYCPTTTPGKIIGDTLMKTIGAEQDRIGLADNMNKLIAALIGELTKEVTHGIFRTTTTTTSSGTTVTGSAGATATYVYSSPASSITNTSATLNGYIGTTFASTPGTTWFEWGTSDVALMPAGTASSTSLYIYPGSTALVPTYSFTLNGLTIGTTYYFRAVGQPSQGSINYGDTRTFKTL